MRSGIALSAALALGGCATLGPTLRAPADREVARCERAYAIADKAIERAEVRDAYGARMPGFPYLRSDRFLASFAAEPLSATEREALVRLMAAAEADARAVELDNLPSAARGALDGALADDAGRTLKECGEALRRFDASSPESAASLAQAARVPDDYDTWKRVVGLYPLAAIPFSVGVSRYEADIRATFAAPLGSLPVRGALVHYVPRGGERLSTEAVARLLARAPRDALGIPQLTADEALALAWSFAPDLVIDVATDDDRPGAPRIAADGAPGVDAKVPLAYVRIAYTRVAGRVLPQVVYTFWFAARPRTAALDLLGGRLDGIMWRVTIAADGRPLVFDSIHPCGCYHQFFPTPRASVRAPEPTLEETAFVPQRLPRLAAEDRVALRIESGTHYIQRILVDAPAPPTAQGYSLVPDGRLRRLPRPDVGTASLFGPDGIVPGTERRERYVFWPMGIREPGAMRQWSRHPTAFVGRRHFDDPYLLDRYFVVGD